MPAPGVFWRIIIAVVCIVALNLLLAPVSHLIGIPLSNEAEVVIRICAGLIALFYILRGPAITPRT